jgi:hypothetical protein
MYLMKISQSPVTSQVNQKIKVPKGQIMDVIYTEVWQKGLFIKSVSMPILVEDCDDYGSQKVYHKKYAILTGITSPGVSHYKPAIYDIYFNKDKDNGCWFCYNYYYYDPSTFEYKLKAVTGVRHYILDKDSLKFYRTTSAGSLDGNVIDVFKFLINPQSFKIDYKKSNTNALTSKGWVFQHWGEAIPVISVNGQTLMTKPVIPVSGDALSDNPYLLSVEYKNLLELQKWYLENNQYRNPIVPEYLIGIYYRGSTYIGHFESFSVTENADKPLVRDYDFSFSVEDIHNNSYDFGA